MNQNKIAGQEKIYENFLIYTGGTSVRQAVANTHLRFMENLYRSVPAAKLPWTVTVHTVVPAMDQANPDLKRLQSLFEDEAAILGSGADLSVIRLSDYICREQADSEQKGVPWTVSSFGDLPNPIITDNLYFPTEADTLEFLYGYFKNIAMGSVVAPQVFEKAVENKDGSPNGLARIIDYVAHCSGGQVIHVVICGPSGWGGEGRTHTNILPAFLFRKCVQKLAGADRMTEEDAERHVREHLLIDVVMHGAYFRFPALEKDKDVRRLTRETLANFDPASADIIRTFALIDHALTCVLAEQPSGYGNQYRHDHAAEVTAYEVTMKCLQETFEGKRFVLPHYAVAGPRTSWAAIDASELTHRMMVSFLRFYAVLEYFLKPQLGTCLADINDDDIYYTRIAALYYGQYGAGLKECRNRDKLEKELLIPFWILYRRSREVVRWIYDISLTGKDWSTGDTSLAEQYTSLFNVPEIERLLGEGEGRPQINDFQLDSLSECSEGNLASTNLTPDSAILKLKAFTRSGRGSFMDMLKEIYEIVRI